MNNNHNIEKALNYLWKANMELNKVKRKPRFIVQKSKLQYLQDEIGIVMNNLRDFLPDNESDK